MLIHRLLELVHVDLDRFASEMFVLSDRGCPWPAPGKETPIRIAVVASSIVLDAHFPRENCLWPFFQIQIRKLAILFRLLEVLRQ